MNLPTESGTETTSTTDQPTSSQHETFRRMHLRYRRCVLPKNNIATKNDDANDVVDLHTQSGMEDTRIERINIQRPVRHDCSNVTAVRTSTSTNNDNNNNNDEGFLAYRLKDYPGCILIPNALSVPLQIQLAHRAVTHYCCDDSVSSQESQSQPPQQPPPPQQQQHAHVTNLSSILSSDDTTHTSLWNEWKQIQPQNRRQQNNRPNDASSKRPRSQPRLEKLSWATMGYHYDWTNRSYPPPLLPVSSLVASESSLPSSHAQPPSPPLPTHYSPMPDELQHMATIFTAATQCYYDELRKNKATNNNNNPQHEYLPNDPNYHATACIVNYYNTKSVMGIHRDEIELALHQPVISISIGCAGIFLFGGTTLDVNDDPTKENGDDNVDDESSSDKERLAKMQLPPVIPILLRSGDVILFGGPNRLNYHSMPRIVPNSFLGGNFDDTTVTGSHTAIENPPVPSVQHQHHHRHQHLCVDQIFDKHAGINNSDQDEVAAVQDYLSNHRININIRQVY